jgi:hypothetical protein
MSDGETSAISLTSISTNLCFAAIPLSVAWTPLPKIEPSSHLTHYSTCGVGGNSAECECEHIARE